MGRNQGRVVIAGGSGLLGTALAGWLRERGFEVAVLSRSGVVGNAAWDGRTVGAWKELLEGARAVVNLAGRSVDCLKTPNHCDEILRSRVESTRAIGMALRDLRQRPEVWVQMSTAHAYGDPPRAVCEEDSPLGFGLAPTVARAWEEAQEEFRPPDVRRVVLRTSFVLARRGGALPTLARLMRFGLGGRIGSGTQGVSWIHERDMMRLFERAILNRSMQGVYIATAPEPVSMREFMRELRGAIGMPLALPSPEWMVRLGSFFLRRDPELALYGRYCVSRRLREEGFEFEFGEVRGALRALFSPSTGN